MQKTLIIIITLIFLSACSSNSSFTSIAPEGMNQEFYQESVGILKLINLRMSSNEKMKKQETDKVEDFLSGNHGDTQIESRVHGYLSILYPTYASYLETTDTKEQEKIKSIYDEDYLKLSKLLGVN